MYFLSVCYYAEAFSRWLVKHFVLVQEQKVHILSPAGFQKCEGFFWAFCCSTTLNSNLFMLISLHTLLYYFHCIDYYPITVKKSLFDNSMPGPLLSDNLVYKILQGIS